MDVKFCQREKYVRPSVRYRITAAGMMSGNVINIRTLISFLTSATEHTTLFECVFQIAKVNVSLRLVCSSFSCILNKQKNFTHVFITYPIYYEDLLVTW
jgi:hypothetical protein